MQSSYGKGAVAGCGLLCTEGGCRGCLFFGAVAVAVLPLCASSGVSLIKCPCPAMCIRYYRTVSGHNYVCIVLRILLDGDSSSLFQ